MKPSFIKYVFVIAFLYSVSSIAQIPKYKDPNASIDDRINDLLSRMTLDEKIGQMTQADNAATENMDDVNNYYLGSILSGGGSDPSSGNSPLDWANLYDSFQLKAMQSRLEIPLIYGIDAVHGHSNVVGAVIFPHNIGLGATRNPKLIEQASRITAVEIAATGIDWTFAPCVAVPRDERWGRTYEGFGETPELTELLAGPAVLGFQNDTLNSPTSVVACAKHYIGDGGTTNGDDQGNTEVSEEELRAIHLPGYVAAIENNTRTIMASYNSWNGTKLHGDKYLLTDVLKTELGFDGFIISDWAAIDQIPGDYASDVEISINAGIDMVMVPNNYSGFFTTLKSLVQQGKVTEARIDDAVARILRVKFEFGLFENPFADRSLLNKIGSEAHRSVARECVRESMVLLKKNDNILPLPKSGSKILVAGEHANNLGFQCGGWTIQWQGASGNVTEGTTILEGLENIAPSNQYVYDPDGNFDEADNDADYIIAVIGEEPYAEGNGDSDDLIIRKDQIQLVRKLKNLGKPVITILISGRPMIINPVLHNSDAFIAAWLPGTEGDGVAEVLVGDYQPKGLLPMTWPKSMDQIPINFGDDNYNPLFAYDFGISSYENSAVGSSPLLQSGLVTEDGLHIELAFNKSMANESNTDAQFSVTRNESEYIQVVNYNLSKIDNNIIILEIGDEVFENDLIKISYAGGNISSADNGTLEVFEDVDAINYLNHAQGIHSLPGRIQAEDYSAMSGIQTEGTGDLGGGLNVGWIDDGDWLDYECEIQFSGSYFINFRIASESSGGILKVLVNGTEKLNRNIPITGGWQTWNTATSIIDLEAGTHTIRLYAEKGGFNLNWFDLTTITDVDYNQNNLDYSLDQNYPNPFNPTTKISYSIKNSSMVKLQVFDVLGRIVTKLVSEYQNPGTYKVEFNGNNLTSGVYYYKLEAGSYTKIKKMLLIK